MFVTNHHSVDGQILLYSPKVIWHQKMEGLVIKHFHLRFKLAPYIIN